MKRKKIYLLLIGIVSIILLFSEHTYYLWLTKRITGRETNIKEQIEHLSLEDRYIYKFGESYILCDNIGKNLKGFDDALILLPPDSYVKGLHITTASIPEPAIFYYFTGVRAVTADIPDARNANYVLYANKKGFKLHKIRRQKQLDSVITLFRQFSY